MVEQWGTKIGKDAGVAVSQLVPWFVSVGKDIIGVAGDRPIGQIADGSTRIYNPQVLSFDLARMREASAHEMGKGPGVWWLRVKDDPKIGGGEYEMFIKVNYALV